MMEASDKERERLQRLREASEWLLHLQSAERNEQTVEEWLRWCDIHAENFNTFQRLQQGWKELDALKPYARALRGDVLPQAEESAWDSRPAGGKLRRMAWALAAAVGVIAVSLGVFHQAWRRPTPATQEVTAATVNRAATLPDGSKMILGAQSRVDMNFDGPKRRLDLSKGEAYFKVRHDRTRPFVVQAGEVSVTAIGTAFGVRRDRDDIIVTVEEGVVDVARRSSGGRSATWRAEAGYQVTYSTRDRSASLASVNTSAELAWRSGELAYFREPLASVVEDLNRYSPRKLVLEDAKVAGIRFTGTAFASSVEDWATGISQIYPVEVGKTESGQIVLRSRN